jgi:hypothetical protein
MVKLQPKHHRKACREYVSEMLSRMGCVNFGIHYPHIIDWDNSETGLRWCYYKASLLCDYLKSHNGLAEYDSALSRERPDASGSYDTALLNCVQVCIRAACDVAVAPSAGVVGYTIGDLRSMWAPRPLPSWVTAFFEKPELVASAPDDAGVWL